MKSSILSKTLLTTVLALLLSISSASAHCQVPCGIYGDQLQIDQIRQHITTISKSMAQISELSGKSPVNYNQLVRWVNNKEEHAQLIQDAVSAYWLTQRIKPADPKDKKAHAKYLNQCALLHQMLFYAMKCKQTTDAGNAEKLSATLDAFSATYFGAKEKAHMEKSHKDTDGKEHHKAESKK